MSSKILDFLREPLVHFLAAGFGLFILFGWISGPGADDPRVITVNRANVLTFLQFRLKAFDQEKVSRAFDSMTAEQRKRLIDDYVREEALYREAQSLELERNDYVIKRRLIQKLEFITKGFTSAGTKISDEDIKAYYEANKRDYYVQPIITFTHVYFESKKRGKEKALAAARHELKTLKRNNVAFSDAVRFGDRFPYHVNYVERDEDYVGSHFSKEMAKKLFGEEVKKDVWTGPFESAYGYHLVLVSKKTKGRDPELKEVYELVRGDAEVAKQKEELEKAEKKIVERYEVRNELK